MKKILMVCMGNICRSPMAKAVLQKTIAEVAVAGNLQVDSAGTAAHAGDRVDGRALAALERRGYMGLKHRARRVVAKDFESFDLILAMDSSNLADLQKSCPHTLQHKVKLLTFFAPSAAGPDVPDPYFGNVQGFEKVLDLCEVAIAGLVRHHQAGSL